MDPHLAQVVWEHLDDDRPQVVACSVCGGVDNVTCCAMKTFGPPHADLAVLVFQFLCRPCALVECAEKAIPYYVQAPEC